MIQHKNLKSVTCNLKLIIIIHRMWFSIETVLHNNVFLFLKAGTLLWTRGSAGKIKLFFKTVRGLNQWKFLGIVCGSRVCRWVPIFIDTYFGDRCIIGKLMIVLIIIQQKISKINYDSRSIPIIIQVLKYHFQLFLKNYKNRHKPFRKVTLPLLIFSNQVKKIINAKNVWEFFFSNFIIEKFKQHNRESSFNTILYPTRE